MYREPKARAKKAMLTLRDLVKATRPPGAGWQPIPGGHRHGFRRRKAKGWEYWYPDDHQTPHARVPDVKEWKTATEFTEAEFVRGDFDKDPTHWHWKLTGGDMKPWVLGGVDPQSKHPVKVGGVFAKLYQVEQAEDPAHPGYAILKEVGSGKKIMMQHDRIFPIEHNPRKRLRTKQEPETQSWTPGTPPKKPGKITGISGKRAPVFEGSTASKEKQPGLYAIENGAYPMMESQRWERDEDGSKRRVKTEMIAVTDHGKNLLVKEFEPLIMSTAKSVAKKFGLKMQYERSVRGERAINVTLHELQRSGVEGLLRAIETYDGKSAFAPHAKQFVTDYIRLGAARERLGGVTLPAKHARNIGRYIAARAQAAKELGISNPSPEDVAPFFKLLKRHVHSNLGKDQGSQPVPMSSYKIAAVREGSPVIRRQTGQTIGGEDTIERDTVTHPGKLEWMNLYHSFLEGQSGASEMFDEDAFALPGLGMGLGYSPEERVSIRQAVQRALDHLSDFEITTEGRKKITYKGDAGEMLALKLGLYGDEEMSVREIAKRVPVYVKGKPLATRQAETVIAEMLERAVSKAREYVTDRDAKTLMKRAEEVLSPPVRAEPGPTWHEIVRERAKQVTAKQVHDYREEERARLQRLLRRSQERFESASEGNKLVHENALRGAEEALRRVDKMSDDEIRLRIAQRASPMTREMHRLMTQTVTVDVPAPRGFERGYQEMTLTDLATGAQRRIRIPTLRDLRHPEDREIEKSEKRRADAKLTTGMLREAINYPLTMRLLVAPAEQIASAPTSARRTLELLSGLGE